MPYRSKGEYVRPTKTLEMMDKYGPTRAARDLGVSASRLHKARRTGEVSKVVEVAATALLRGPLLKNAVPHQVAAEERFISSAPEPAEKPAAPATSMRGEETMFLISVPAEKAELVRHFAAKLDAECISA